MTWVAVAVGVGTAATGAYSSYAAGQAQSDAARRAGNLSDQNYRTNLALMEPWRAAGYGALQQLAAMRGTTLPDYRPAAEMVPIKVKGKSGGSSASNYGPNPSPLAGLGHDPRDYLGGGSTRQFGGTIDPGTGTVDVKGGGSNRDALLTEYLRTGEWTGGKGGKMTKLRSAIDNLRARGYDYDPNAQNVATTGGTPMDRMEWLQSTPGYQFTRDEGMRDIQNQAAARGAMGGPALRALAEFNSGLASRTFGDEYNRLSAEAGIGQTATQNIVNVGSSNAATQANAAMAQGDARASGVMGVGNSIANGANAGLNTYYWQKYINNIPGSTGAANAPSAAWRNYGNGGYQFNVPNYTQPYQLPPGWESNIPSPRGF